MRYADSAVARRITADDISTVVDKSAKSQAEKAARAAARTARRRAPQENPAALYAEGRKQRNRGLAQMGAGAALTGAGVYGVARANRKEEASKGLARQSVMPTLARVKPNGNLRRMVTGDALNTRRVIGKGVYTIPSSQISRGGKAGVKQLRATSRQAEMSQWQRARPGQVEKFSPTGLWRGFSAGAKQVGAKAQGAWGGAKAGFAGVKTSAALPSSRTASVGGAVAQGEKFGMAGQRAVTGAKSRPGLVLAGAGAAGAGAGYSLNKADLAKRRFDPEDERRHYRGAATGLAAAGGLAALGNAGRIAGRDRQQLRDSLPNKVDISGLKPKPLVGKPRRINSEADDAYTTRLQARVDDHKARTDVHARTTRQLKNAEALRGRKLVPVGGRSAGHGLAGLALIGTAAGLHRNRHEERWD